MTDRVAITGLGAVSAAGIGVEALWTAARQGRSGVRPIDFPRAPPLRVKTAAHLLDFDPATRLGGRVRAVMDRFSSLALLAADEACAQSSLPKGEAGERCAVIIGSGIGGSTTIDNECYDLYVHGRNKDAFGVAKAMPSAAASQVSMRYGAKGPSFCVSSACCSATQAIGIGLYLIRAGLVDKAIVGGSESLFTPSAFRSWELLPVLTPTLCRPFSLKRDGMVLGEAAAIIVLESFTSAERRGATPIAELAGYGTSSDAADLLRPDVDGAKRAMEAALADAGVSAAEIGYVNAHGTGTGLNDATESAALAAIFGDRLQHTPVTSTKPIHGHTLGAAGAIEIIITLKALIDQIAPPTINWLEPDPQCPLDVVPLKARAIETRTALSNSFAFGGINACLVVRRI